MAKNFTSRSEDFSKWYNELVVKADLAQTSDVRGCMVIKPYGYSIWESMQAELDKKFKKTGRGKWRSGGGSRGETRGRVDYKAYL